MDKNKTAVEAFLGELEGHNEKNTFETPKEDPFIPEETPVEKEPEEEKALPFNKDPKIQKYLEKREREMEERIKNSFKPEVITKEPEKDEVTDVLIRLIGNDTPEKLSMVKEFKSILEKGTERAKAEALAELDSRQTREQQADRDAEIELETAFDNIEEIFDVDITSNNPIAKKTRQEFVSFVEKIAPKDRNGDVIDYPDMNSAWETFSEMKKATSVPSRAKELASRGMSRSAETQPNNQTKVGWDAAEEFISSLK